MGEQEQYVDLFTDEICGWKDPRERLAHAIENDSFALYAQDIVAIGGTALLGREILVRMREEEDLLLPPGAFFPILEHFGMMPTLDSWILRNVVRMIESEPPSALHFINVSSQALSDEGFLAQLARSGEQFPFLTATLCLEIDEIDARSQPHATERFVTAARDAGFRLALDHFGKGRVAFELLMRVRADFVKIDASQILGLGRADAVAIATIRAVNRVCRRVGVAAIAQCVESEQVCRRLARIGIEYAQGYHVGAPAPLQIPNALEVA